MPPARGLLDGGHGARVGRLGEGLGADRHATPRASEEVAALDAHELARTSRASPVEHVEHVDRGVDHGEGGVAASIASRSVGCSAL